MRMRDIMCNEKLFKMKKLSNPDCEWCNNPCQTVIHLFWDCPVNKQIWTEITNYVNETLGCALKIEKELIFLYDIEAGNLIVTIINLIIIIVCRAIYVCKCIGMLRNWIYVKSKIDEIENMERLISVKNNKLTLHNKKWGKFVRTLTSP